MNYKYSETAGYYGKGGWVVYSYGCIGGKSVHAVLATEEEAREYCDKAKRIALGEE